MRRTLLVPLLCLVCRGGVLAEWQASQLLEGTSVRRETAEISACAGLLAAHFLYLDDAEPWADRPLLHTHYRPYTGRATVPKEALVVAGSALGCAIFLLPSRKGWLSPNSYRHAKGFLEASAVCTPVVTAIAKLSVGKRRPDYRDRPHPNGDEADARKSFWSGHASVSFAFATYSSVYLYEYVADNTGRHLLWKMPVSLALYGGATYVAWSRVHDHAHDALDVTTGAVMGSVISLVIYGLHDNWFGPYYACGGGQSIHLGPSQNGARIAYRF